MAAWLDFGLCTLYHTRVQTLYTQPKGNTRTTPQIQMSHCLHVTFQYLVNDI